MVGFLYMNLMCLNMLDIVNWGAKYGLTNFFSNRQYETPSMDRRSIMGRR